VLACTKTVETNTTRLIVSGLKKGINYSVFVTAANAAGEGLAVGMLHALTLSSPGPVRNLKLVQTLGQNKFFMSWNEPSDIGAGDAKPAAINYAMYYKIMIYDNQTSDEYGKTPLFEQKFGPGLHSAPSLYLPDDLDKKILFTRGIVYFVSVRASTEGGDSSSKWVSACALSTSSAPVLTSVELVGPGKILLSFMPPSDIGAGFGTSCWNPATDSDTGYVNTLSPPVRQDKILMYAVEISSNVQFIPVIQLNGSDLLRISPNITWQVIEGLREGSFFYFRVFAETISGSSQPSLSRKSIIAAVPTAPTSLAAAMWGPEKLLVSFQPSVEVGESLAISGYLLEVAKDVMFGSHSINISLEPNKTSFVLSGLTAGDTYFMRVKAVNFIGAGSYSSVVAGYPLGFPGIPSNIVVRAVEGLRFSISWQVF
jgi:hypothetical protein